MTRPPRVFPAADDTPYIDAGFSVHTRWVEETVPATRRTPEFTREVPFTLIARRAERPTGRGVIFVHGWADYFFHPHVADFFNERGFDFCAVDVRRAGRSLRDGDIATHVRDLEDFAVEIDAARAFLAEDAKARGLVSDKPLLYAHSMGGLIAVTYARRHSSELAGLALNSPWLNLHGGKAMRCIALPLASALAAKNPDSLMLPAGGDFHAHFSRRDYGGPWTWHDAYKPAGGFAFPAATMAAVIRAQNALEKSGGLSLPVFMATSTRTSFSPRWRADLLRRDTVLSVRGQWAMAKHVGSDLTRAQIPGAAHDITLSGHGARRAFFAELDRWLADKGLAGEKPQNS